MANFLMIVFHSHHYLCDPICFKLFIIITSIYKKLSQMIKETRKLAMLFLKAISASAERPI